MAETFAPNHGILIEIFSFIRIYREREKEGGECINYKKKKQKHVLKRSQYSIQCGSMCNYVCDCKILGLLLNFII